MKSIHPAAAIVLAAGRSVRMGQPKQLLPLKASTVLNQTLANLERSAITEVILVLGANAEEIRPGLAADTNVRFAQNDRYAEGMSTSLHAGLEALNPATESVLIVLADQPFIRPDTLTQLAYHATRAPILIPTYQSQRGNPVRLDRSLFPEVFALTGDTGCRALFGLHAVELLEVEDEGILQDLDTPSDYEAIVLKG